MPGDMLRLRDQTITGRAEHDPANRAGDRRDRSRSRSPTSGKMDHLRDIISRVDRISSRRGFVLPRWKFMVNLPESTQTAQELCAK